MSGNQQPEWEVAIRRANNAHSANRGYGTPNQTAAVLVELTDTLEEIGVQIVRAIREVSEVPVPFEVLEALIPVSSDELKALAARNPAQADFLLAMAQLRLGMEGKA
jgi:hypothetical protein